MDFITHSHLTSPPGGHEAQSRVQLCWLQNVKYKLITFKRVTTFIVTDRLIKLVVSL